MSIPNCASVSYRFSPSDLLGDPNQKTALLINPPIHDTQYWAEWSQPYGLLRIARLLGNLGYRHRELFDYVELQRLMYMLNAHYRSRSFQLFGDSLVAGALCGNMRNGFEEFVPQYQTPAELPRGSRKHVEPGS